MIINFKNTPIHLDIYGKGKPVVLIHGFLEERKIWSPMVDELKQDYQLIIPDMFGHGETPQHKGIHTMEEMAEAVAFILDYLGISSVPLIGHSMGGYISMAFLEKFPDCVKGVLLLNSSPQEDSPERLKERDQVIKIVQKHKQIFIKSAVRNLFAEESKEIFSKELEEKIDEAMKMNISSIIAAVKGMKIRKDRENILKNFQGQKFIIAGEEDALIPFEVIREVAQNTGSTFIGLPGGHMSYIEQKEKTLSSIREFLRRK